MPVSRNTLIELHPKRKITNVNISCVYRIWFGDKYYIGKTQNLKNRIYAHEYDLTRHLRNYELGIINPYYQHIVKHILENNLSFGFYEVLMLCHDENTRMLAEQSWFNICCDDLNCLNYGFESKPFIPEVKKPAKVLTNKQKISALRKTLNAIK